MKIRVILNLIVIFLYFLNDFSELNINDCILPLHPYHTTQMGVDIPFQSPFFPEKYLSGLRPASGSTVHQGTFQW